MRSTRAPCPLRYTFTWPSARTIGANTCAVGRETNFTPRAFHYSIRWADPPFLILALGCNATNQCRKDIRSGPTATFAGFSRRALRGGKTGHFVTPCPSAEPRPKGGRPAVRPPALGGTPEWGRGLLHLLLRIQYHLTFTHTNTSFTHAKL